MRPLLSPTATPAAPRLPGVGELAPHFPTLDFPEDGATAMPAPAGPPRRVDQVDDVDRIVSRATEVHRGFLQACGDAQSQYLRLLQRRLEPAEAPPPADAPLEGDAALATWVRVAGEDLYLDTEAAPWLNDHKPDFGVAIVPMTGLVDLLAATAQASRPGHVVTGLEEVTANHWMVVEEEPRHIRREVRELDADRVEVRLLAWRQAARADLSRYEPIVSGVVRLGSAHPSPPAGPEDLADAAPSKLPYEDKGLFHGPAFQRLVQIASGPRGATGHVDYGGRTAGVGLLPPVAVDAALHAACDKRWAEWCPGSRIDSGNVMPLRLVEGEVYGPAPREGVHRVEMRGRGTGELPSICRVEFYLYDGAQPWMRLLMELVAVPEGPLDGLRRPVRHAFLAEGHYVEEALLSSFDGAVTTLHEDVVARANWIPRTLECAYHVTGADDLTRIVAQKEHAARQLGRHPREITIEADLARCGSTRLRLQTRRDGISVIVATEAQ